MTNLGSHELWRTAERARRLTELHILLAQTVIRNLHMTIEGQKNIIQLQVAENHTLNQSLVIRLNGDEETNR